MVFQFVCTPIAEYMELYGNHKTNYSVAFVAKVRRLSVAMFEDNKRTAVLYFFIINYSLARVIIQYVNNKTRIV